MAAAVLLAVAVAAAAEGFCQKAHLRLRVAMQAARIYTCGLLCKTPSPPAKPSLACLIESCAMR